MADRLSGYSYSGMVYPRGYRVRASDMAIYSVSGLAFEAYQTSHADRYGITATEVGSTGEYYFTDPAPDVIGKYYLIDSSHSYLSESDIANNRFWEGEIIPSASGISSSWQSLVLPNNKTYAQAMEFIVAMVGGAKTSGALTTGNQTYVVRDLNDSTNLASISNDGVGNRITITW